MALSDPALDWNKNVMVIYCTRIYNKSCDNQMYNMTTQGGIHGSR